MSTGNPRPIVRYMRAAVERLQAERKAAGLPWYGGRTPGWRKVVVRMDDAIVKLDQAIEQLPAAEDLGELGPLIVETASDGLLLARDTVRMVRTQLLELGPEADIKLLRLGNEAGLRAAGLAVRSVEAAFRGRNTSAVERLLEELAAEKKKPAEAG